MKHYFIDFDRDNKTFSWMNVMNNLLNTQSKHHHKLIGRAKKLETDFDADDSRHAESAIRHE